MLLSHIMKVLERILGGRIRKSVEMDIREQQGFIKGKGMMDGSAGSRSHVGGRDGQGNEGKSFGWSWDV